MIYEYIGSGQFTLSEQEYIITWKILSLFNMQVDYYLYIIPFHLYNIKCDQSVVCGCVSDECERIRIKVPQINLSGVQSPKKKKNK